MIEIQILIYPSDDHIRQCTVLLETEPKVLKWKIEKEKNFQFLSHRQAVNWMRSQIKNQFTNWIWPIPSGWWRWNERKEKAELSVSLWRFIDHINVRHMCVCDCRRRLTSLKSEKICCTSLVSSSYYVFTTRYSHIDTIHTAFSNTLWSNNSNFNLWQWRFFSSNATRCHLFVRKILRFSDRCKNRILKLF